jgi:hypothetical protein
MTTHTETMHSERCCTCLIWFEVPDAMHERRKADGQLFYCPNGHGQHYTASVASQLATVTAERDEWQKEAERLLEQCDLLRAQLAALQRAPAPLSLPAPTKESLGRKRRGALPWFVR